MGRGDRRPPRAAAPIFAAICLFLSCFAPPSIAAAPDWPFADEFRSRLAFVHPLVNYAIHPTWQRDWERNLASRSGLQVTSGSVATDDLFTDLTVNVTEPLDGRFRFLYRLVWREGLHLDRDRQEHLVGFEGRVAGGLGAFLQANPAPDKEELDLAAGLLLTGATRERYLRLGVRWDDFLYERKNDRGGLSDGEPVSVTWEARHATGPWEVFSAGRYGSGSRRAYPDASLSPALAASFRRDGAGVLRVRHILSTRDFVGLEVSHYRFQAEDRGRGAGGNQKYDHEWVHLRALGVWSIGGPWSLRPEIHWLRQWGAASGGRIFTHRREDFFPALFAAWRSAGRSTWELGYMAVDYGWNHTVGARTDDTDGYTDKLELGWTFAFRPDARLQFSLSHELDLDRFGGGNVQYQMGF